MKSQTQFHRLKSEKYRLVLRRGIFTINRIQTYGNTE